MSANVPIASFHLFVYPFYNIPRVKSVLSSLACLVWSVAWSSVAVEAAVAAVCFKMVWARIEAGAEGLWKRVMTSFLADYYEAYN